MHKVYENDDVMMNFKKRYCHCCGKVLQRKRTERIVKKGDPDHRAYCSIGSKFRPHGDILVIGKEYYCSSCNKAFSCDEQGEVIETQKYYKKKIVTKEEIDDVSKIKMSSFIQKIKKYRWILLFPLIGGIICLVHIFNSRLSKKTSSKDGSILLLSSIITFIGVALIIKLVLLMFNNIEFARTYENLITLIPSLFSFNIPILCYINHKF